MVNEQAWANLEADKQNLQPTPRVGSCVQWYPGNDPKQPYAGRVTGIDGPGRLKIEVAIINGIPQHKKGVYHVTASIHEQKGNFSTREHGSWDYVYGPAPDSDYDLHRDELARREKNLLAAEEAAAKTTELMAAKQAAKPTMPATKKKPLPEPIPASAF